jgi:hypothetical protein
MLISCPMHEINTLSVAIEKNFDDELTPRHAAWRMPTLQSLLLRMINQFRYYRRRHW